jgi:hypothetical protein
MREHITRTYEYIIRYLIECEMIHLTTIRVVLSVVWKGNTNVLCLLLCFHHERAPNFHFGIELWL